MKIGISTSVVQRGKTGVAHYLFSLLKEIRAIGQDHSFVLFVLEEDVPLFDFLEGAMEMVRVPEGRRAPLANIRWHQMTLPRLAKNWRLDALHVPSYRRLLFAAPCAKIGTIHDLAPFHLAGKYDWARMFYGRYVARALARRQDALIAVSQTTARDITRFFGIAEKRIDVIHNGLDHARFQPEGGPQDEATLANFKLNDPYFLYVARLEHPGKNHVRLIEAFNRFKTDHGSRHLLVLGGADWHGAKAIHAAAEQSPFAKDIRLAGYVSDQQLPPLYRHATAMCYPSLFEGFGMPPVEAMACGCPVICSARGALGEIVSSAARIVDPENIFEMAEALKRIALEPKEAETLRRKGLSHAARYSWRKAAESTLAVYERFNPVRSVGQPARTTQLDPA